MNKFDELLDTNPLTLYSEGGGIKKSYLGSFVIQCPSTVDAGVYPSFETAVERWLKLKIEGKI